MKRVYFLSVFMLLATLLNAQQAGDNIFNTGQLIHEVRITFPFNGWLDTLKQYHTIGTQLDSNIYLMATSVEFDGVAYDSVGCKFKGNSSYNNNSDKKSWKLDFEEFKAGNEIDGLKQLNLNNGFKDPTLLREKICLDFLRHYGIPAPRADYANVYVNNQLWGLYILVEEVDKTFVKSHFGNKGGNLFKGDPHGDLRWKGANAASYYADYELKTNEDINDWSDLVWLLDNINNTPAGQEYRDSLDVSFNTASFIKSWATTSLFVNLDSYTGSGHNYYIYHNTDSSRFEWINWDVNEAFGVFLNGLTSNQLETLPMNYVPTPQTNRPLLVKLTQDSVYWHEFQNFVCNALNDYFNPTNMGYIIDSLHNRIKTDAYADPRKFFPNNQFDSNIDTDLQGAFGLKPFVQTRYDYLTQQLDSFSCVSLVSGIKKVGNADVVNVFPNPAGDQVTINCSERMSTIQLFEIDGRSILQKQLYSNTTVLDVHALIKRCYLYVITTVSGDLIRGKLVKE
ncbi:MAG: CotH kinase family protein [Chitinophagales bacterium]